MANTYHVMTEEAKKKVDGWVKEVADRLDFEVECLNGSIRDGSGTLVEFKEISSDSRSFFRAGTGKIYVLIYGYDYGGHDRVNERKKDGLDIDEIVRIAKEKARSRLLRSRAAKDRKESQRLAEDVLERLGYYDNDPYKGKAFAGGVTMSPGCISTGDQYKPAVYIEAKIPPEKAKEVADYLNGLWGEDDG